MVAGEVTLVTAVDIPSVATMAVATTADTVATVGVAATDGASDIGAIRTTSTDGAGDGDLALGGRTRIGNGDTHMATSTALGITLPTPTTIRRTALRAIGVLPMETTTLRHRIPPRNPRATQRNLGGPR
jgi:hypothetical protein